MAHYDEIGLGYAIRRCTDPTIYAALARELETATTLLNIGAGAGSYEPSDASLVALEPAWTMLTQRPSTAHPAVQGNAEQLPFPDKSFSHCMTVLSMHHWQNRARAFAEINRVTKERFVAISWNPEASPFWLTRDYFPGIHAHDVDIFPGLAELHAHFDELQVQALPIPENCEDGFLAAFWKRPEAYLSEEIRQSISSFAALPQLQQGLAALRTDLDSGRWASRNADVLAGSTLDAGYWLITAEPRAP